MSIASVMPSSHLILWCVLLLCPQSFPASWTFSMSQLFTSDDQNTGASASASVLPGLISLKIDWFDFFAVQGTFGSLLQHHSSKTYILWRSPFFTVQLSQPYMTTGKTTTLTIRIFVRRLMSLLFCMILYHCGIIQNNISLKILCDSLINPSLHHAPGNWWSFYCIHNFAM